MTMTQWRGTPADIAAERADILAEVGDSTLLSVYAQTAADNPEVIAHRWQAADGSWASLSYRQARGQVRDAALGLAAAGFSPGEFAVIWSGNRVEATIADYAVMHAGGVPVFLYNTLAPEQAGYIAGHCEATVAIVGDLGYLDKLLAVRDQLPKLRAVLLIEGEHPQARPWADLLAAGQAEHERDPGAFDATWRQVAGSDLATLIYTSGTTGAPKGVMISHRNARSYQVSIAKVLDPGSYAGPDGSRVVSYLPMAHVTGRSVDHWAPMARAGTIYYCPDQLKVFEVAAAAHPTLFFGTPRVWEKLHSAIRAGLAGLGMPDATSQTVAALPDEVKQAILARPGLESCQVASSGSAPLDPEIIAFFRALGVPLTEGWGMSELSNAATISAPDDARVGTVGRAMPGIEARIAGDGEILIRGPLVMEGYYKDPARTAETLDADGWLHTGDIGEVDADGYLKITDRKKELIITSGGKNISPAQVEYELQRAPLIGQACAIGDRRNYLTALLVLDADAALAWAAQHGLGGLSLAELAAEPAVLAEVERGVAEANGHLARVEQVRRWKLLPAEWTADGGELTPTMKKRRRVITAKYAAEIDALYS